MNLLVKLYLEVKFFDEEKYRFYIAAWYPSTD